MATWAGTLPFFVATLSNVLDSQAVRLMIKLESLHLKDNKLTDLKGVENLTNLKLVFLRGNKLLPKKQIAELQKALPNCEVKPFF